MLKVLVDVTEEMKDAYACCSEDSDCSDCPCRIGKDDCVFNYEMDEIR